MTIDEKMLQMMVERGLIESQAKEIMQRVKTTTDIPGMPGRWADSTEAYGPQSENIVWLIWLFVRPVALGYIDEHCPEAWYRSMFEAPTKSPQD